VEQAVEADQDAITSVWRIAGAARRPLVGRRRPGRPRGDEGRGCPISEARPDFVADVRQRTVPLVQDWIKSANAKGVDGAKAWAEYQDELKKVAVSLK
jgi:hypothetical protein